MRFAILSFPGSSCDRDMQRVLADVLETEATIVKHTDADFDGYDAVIIPAGASYGDYIRPGALAKSSPAISKLRSFAASGKPVLGVGNGFQILTEAGLLPGAFLPNASLKFDSGTALLNVETSTALFTSAFGEGRQIRLPFAHAYGTYYVDEETHQQLMSDDRIAFTYADAAMSGSTGRIAGVLNEGKNVLGLMALPERAAEELIGGTDGLPLFQSIVKNGRNEHANFA